VNRIRTEALLPFAPERVWAVLADFGRYAEWNPLNIRAEGEARLGARVPMTFINPARAGKTVSQTVTVTACEPGRRLAWRGHIPLLFDGLHSFELEPRAGGTHLLHGEDQSGLITLAFSKRVIAEKFVPAYEAMNRALAARLQAIG
jgi:hypothetical protein